MKVISAVIALNPIAIVLITIGLIKLKAMLMGFYTKFLAKIVMVIPGVIGALVGLPFMRSLATALWDCVMQGKKGIEIYIKKSWWGMPYGIGVEAR